MIEGQKGVSLLCEDVVSVARMVAQQCDVNGSAEGRWLSTSEEGITQVVVSGS